MENALFITKVEELRYWDDKYSRLYFGNEFCERLIPSPDELLEVLKSAQKYKCKFSLVTGYVNDEAISKLEKLFEKLFEFKPESEVIINDWGVLRVAYKYKFKLVLGRLLSRQKKGPEVLGIWDDLPEITKEYFQTGCLNDPFIYFLKEQGVIRIELDNALQGIRLDKQVNINVSLYYPYGYITTTRYCFSNCNNRRKGMPIGIYPCKKECQKLYFVLRHHSMTTPLLLKGNTVFFENKEICLSDRQGMVDRIIHEPDIPI